MSKTTLFQAIAPLRSLLQISALSLALAICPSVVAQTSSASTSTSGAASVTSTVNLNLNKGWNLIGTGGIQAFSVGDFFSNTSKITSVWKWISNQSQWAFYAPSMSRSDLQTYATSKGYAALDTLNGSDGFWVNATQAHTVTLPFSSPYTAINHRGSLFNGWNLVADGEANLLPVQFNNRLTQYTGSVPPSVGLDTSTSVYQPNFVSLWSWDSLNSNWFFYAPTLDRDQTLAAYNDSKNYSDFAESNKTLGPGVGFWVNMPSSQVSITSAPTSSSSSSTTVSSTSSTTVIKTGCQQLLGTSGNDVFNPQGYCHQELTLSPGNNTFNLGAANNYQFYLPPTNFSPTSGASINLTSNTVAANSLQLKPRTINNGYGGTDTLNFANSISNYLLYFWSSPLDDYLIKDTGSVYWDITPKSGTDTVISNGGYLGIDLFDFSNANFTIAGSSGTVQPDSNTTLNYQGVNAWSFWNGSYKVNAAASNLSFTFWNNTNNSNFVHQYVSGGGNYHNFSISTSNLIVHILNFNTTARFIPNFLTNFGTSGITPALIEQSISLSNDTTNNTTTIRFTNSNTNNAGTYGESSFVVNGIYSSYTINADNTVSLTLNPQTISFDLPTTQNVGASVVLNATASSGLPVSYSTSTAAVCSITGTTLRFNASGTCSVKASQAGNSSFSAAINVTRAVTVNQAAATQTITFNQPAVQNVGTPLNLTASATSGLSVSYTTSSPLVCSVSGSTVSFSAAGTCSVTASQIGNSAFTAAPVVTLTITVNKAAQAITFTALPGMKASTVTTLMATSSSGLAVTYSASPSNVCTLSSNSLSALAYGNCTVVAAQAGDGTYAAASNVSQTFSVGDLTTGLTQIAGLSNTGQNTSQGAADPNWTYSYTYGSNTYNGNAIALSNSNALLLGGIWNWTVLPNSKWVSTANSIVTIPSAPKQGGIDIPVKYSTNFDLTGYDPATAVITFSVTGDDAIRDIQINGKTLGLQVNGDFHAVYSAQVPIGSLTQAGVNKFSVEVLTTDNNYEGVDVVVSVHAVPIKSAQTITFNQPASQTVGTSLSLSATVSSGLTASFSSSTSSVCSVSGSTLSFSAAGTCSITAAQSGNSSYAAATSVTRSFVVSTAAQTITFNQPATQTSGTTLSLSATATSGLAVSYTASTPSVCSLTGSTLSFVAGGTCTVTANQAGNSAYAAAATVSRSITVNPVTYDLDAQYSSTTNPSGVWSYGETNNWGGAFTKFTATSQYTLANGSNATSWLGANLTSGTPVISHNPSATASCSVQFPALCLTAGGTIFHPGVTSRITTIRFTVPASGTYAVDASFWGADKSTYNGTIVGMLVNGVLNGAKVNITTADVQALSPQKITRTLALTQGQVIDFSVDSNTNISNDSTGIKVVIKGPSF